MQKYLLARLERQALLDGGHSTDAMPDWSSKSVSVEHIYAKFMKRSAFNSNEEYNSFSTMKDSLQNLTLLERTLNTNLDSKPFEAKVATYGQSAFRLTREVGGLSKWDMECASTRAQELAALAVKAWPR